MAKFLKQLASLPPVYTEAAHGAVTGVRIGISGSAPNTAVWFYRVGDTLIDTGSPRGASGVRKYLRKLREQNEDVTQVVTTHHHEGMDLLAVFQMQFTILLLQIMPGMASCSSKSLGCA